MQFAKIAAVLSFAAAARAYSNDTIVWTTVVVDSYTTVCPATATAVINGVTYTNTLTEVRKIPCKLGDRELCKQIRDSSFFRAAIAWLHLLQIQIDEAEYPANFIFSPLPSLSPTAPAPSAHQSRPSPQCTVLPGTLYCFQMQFHEF